MSFLERIPITVRHPLTAIFETIPSTNYIAVTRILDDKWNEFVFDLYVEKIVALQPNQLPLESTMSFFRFLARVRIPVLFDRLNGYLIIMFYSS